MSDRKKRHLLDVGLWIVGMLFVLCLAKTFQVRMSYVVASERYETVKSNAVVEIPADDGNIVDRMIDFGVLKKEGSTASLWITIPGTRVDYPLVHGTDNDRYLETDAYGKASSAGAIFIDYRNDGELKDERTLIYGHNMKDGTMFHDLLSFSDESYAKAHQILRIYASDGTYTTYSLLCTIATTNQNQAVYGDVTGKEAAEIAAAFLPEAAEVYDEVNGGELLVLSTCIKHDRRFVCVFQKE